MRQRAVQQVIERTARTAFKYGEALRAELVRNDFSAVFDQLVRDVGLDPGDAVDVLAGNMALQWMVANNRQVDPPAAAFRGLARQLAAAAAAEPAMADPEARGLMAEETKIQTVVLHAGWQSARREGTLESYAQAIARSAASSGLDLTKVDLTADGFVPRG